MQGPGAQIQSIVGQNNYSPAGSSGYLNPYTDQFQSNPNIGPLSPSNLGNAASYTGQPASSNVSSGNSSNTGSSSSGNNYQAQWSALGRSGTAPVGWHGESGNGGGASLPSLDSLYAPIFASYDAATNQINQAQNQDLTDLTNSYNQNKGLIPGYVSSAQNTINSNQTNLQQQTQSAYDQAAKNYAWASQNALGQFGNTRGPVANTPYDALSALAQQEYAREGGQIGNTALQGQQQINTQNLDLTNWANQQNATLDSQFTQAKDNLNQYFQQQLMAINQDRNATEAQKAAGKQQLIEDVMNQNNAIYQQALNFQQQVQLYSSQLGQTGGQNYNLQNFLANMGTLGNNLASQTTPSNQAYNFATGNVGNNLGNGWVASQNNNNDIANQLLQGTGTSANLPVATQVPSTYNGLNQ